MKIIETTTTKLKKVSQNQLNAILSGDRTTERHQTIMQDLPCMNTIEQGGGNDLNQAVLPSDFRVMAWNVERCFDVKNSAALLAKHNPDIILLSEMDNGMARTQQKNTVKRLAKRLDMYYLFAVEFLELDLGNDIEQQLAQDSYNKKGFHGNAILSKVPIDKAAMVRFDDQGKWFKGLQVGNHLGEPRVGGRIAIMANLPTEDGQSITVVSTHLESNADVMQRDKQMFDLISAAEAFSASGAAIIIGGDLNTGNNLSAGLDHTAESLFETAKSQGFHWQSNPDGTTTRPSRLTLRADRKMKLDWFAAKYIAAHHTNIIPALDKDDVPLSDHEIILADWRLSNTLPTDE